MKKLKKTMLCLFACAAFAAAGFAAISPASAVLGGEGCMLDTDCASGEVCTDAKCVPACKSDSDCESGQTCEKQRCG